jgi:hypothetical protein
VAKPSPGSIRIDLKVFGPHRKRCQNLQTLILRAIVVHFALALCTFPLCLREKTNHQTSDPASLLHRMHYNIKGTSPSIEGPRLRIEATTWKAKGNNIGISFRMLTSGRGAHGGGVVEERGIVQSGAPHMC